MIAFHKAVSKYLYPVAPENVENTEKFSRLLRDPVLYKQAKESDFYGIFRTHDSNGVPSLNFDYSFQTQKICHTFDEHDEAQRSRWLEVNQSIKQTECCEKDNEALNIM